MTRYAKLMILAAIFAFTTAVCVSAEEVKDEDYGYSIDLPEGYTVEDKSDDGMSYLFKHDRMPVKLALKLYNTGTYTAPEEALTASFKKLSAVCTDRESFTWQKSPCSVAKFTMKLDTAYEGWAVSCRLPQNGADLVLLCYADSKIESDCEQFIMSVLNSLSVSKESMFCPGIITSYAFPDSERKDITLSIAGKKIETSIGKDDVQAAKFVIECEYAVLKLYAKDAKWKEAWKRYYRAIYRDSYSRMTQPSKDIFAALFTDASKQNPENPQAVMAQELLTWTQGFEYGRNRTTSDFTSLPAAITGVPNDCDSRSMLLCALLENAGIKCELFISHEYSHAVFGADIQNVSPSENARLESGGKLYLLGDSTAKVNIGLMAQDLTDSTKWIPVGIE